MFLLASDETKDKIVQHKILSIIFYIYFALWALNAVLNLLAVLSLIGSLEFIPLIFLIATIACYGLDCLAGGLYYHIYKTSNGASGNTEPLLNQA